MECDAREARLETVEIITSPATFVYLLFWRENPPSGPATFFPLMSSLKRRERSPSPTRVERCKQKRLLSAEGSPVRAEAPALAKVGARAECHLLAVQRGLTAARVGFPLVDRRSQEDSVREFVTSRNSSGRGGTLYVCGAPGTGKTATVVRVAAPPAHGPSPPAHTFWLYAD